MYLSKTAQWLISVFIILFFTYTLYYLEEQTFNAAALFCGGLLVIMMFCSEPGIPITEITVEREFGTLVRTHGSHQLALSALARQVIGTRAYCDVVFSSMNVDEQNHIKRHAAWRMANDAMERLRCFVTIAQTHGLEIPANWQPEDLVVQTPIMQPSTE